MADIPYVMRYEVDTTDLPPINHAGEGALSFAAFSLAHTECGDDVFEVRIGEAALLEWCMACAEMRIFQHAP